LWGAPRIHGELLKLGFEVAESTVSKYMIGRRGPPSQSWRTFLRNHADAIAAIDLCVVPTLTSSGCLPFLLWAMDGGSWYGDPQSVSGVAGSTDGRGISVEYGAHLFGAGQ